MKKKHLLSGLLAGALVLTSVVVPGAKQVNAEEYDLTKGLVASYSFDKEDLTDGQGGADASAIVTGLGSYSGTLKYVEGKEGQGLQLGDYGLKLNRQNLGEDFTVSLWMKPDANLADNQSGLFLGYHNPEKWLSIAGTETSSCKFWANGNGYSWGELGRTEIASGGWHQVTVTGSASGVTLYVDGEEKLTGKTNSPLSGTNQDIYVGATNWDPEFTGAVDEVKVYNRTLSEGEVFRLYDSTTPVEDILEAEGITVTESMNMVVGRTQKIEVSMPGIVADSNPAVTYESAEKTVATVSQDGTVTAAGEGTTTITTKVTLGDVEVTAKTSVSVTGALADTLVASFDFEDSLENGVEGGSDAAALVSGLTAYSKDLKYDEGREGGKAVHLGDYGLKLNQENIGTEYTVSMWVKSDSTLIANQAVLFMGYHDPENWIAISGSQTSTNKVKFWGNGGIVGKWTTLDTSTIQAGEWHQITVTGTAGKTTLYVDGISYGETVSNDPLNGANQDIYLGVNNWDDEYTGLVDDVKVYSIAMSDKEVQDQSRDAFQEVFEKLADSTLVVNRLLGDNKNSANIIYDLNLMASLDNLSIEWSSSNPDVIAADGKVTSPAKTEDVTVTAKVSNGTLTTEKEFTFTVPSIDRSELDKLIAEAKAIKTDYLTEVSKTRLETAIKNAEEVENSYSAVEKAAADLKLAMDNLTYMDEAVNPFAHIAEPVTQTSLKVGETQDLFTVPDTVKELVEVTYSSEDDKVVTYKDGTITAQGAGKAIVTATVTSKYDGFEMEYSTAVEVTSDTPVVEPGDVTDTTDAENNAGKADLVGDAAAVADAVLTADDKAAVKDGADAKIWLDVQDITETVSDADKALVEAAKGQAQVGMYLDVTLWKQIGSGEAQQVENTDGTVTIKFTVPENLRNTDPKVERTYQIIRVHDGKAEVIACTYDKTTGVITFTTDKFSTYALVYTDKAVQTPVQPGTDDTQKPAGGDGKDPGKAAQTGDTTNIFPAAAACVLAFAAAGMTVAVKVKRRKK